MVNKRSLENFWYLESDYTSNFVTLLPLDFEGVKTGNPPEYAPQTRGVDAEMLGHRSCKAASLL